MEYCKGESVEKQYKWTYYISMCERNGIGNKLDGNVINGISKQLSYVMVEIREHSTRGHRRDQIVKNQKYIASKNRIKSVGFGLQLSSSEFYSVEPLFSL